MPRVVASDRKEATVACEEVTRAILVTPSSDPMWARDLACPASSGAVVRMLGCVGRPPDNVNSNNHDHEIILTLTNIRIEARADGDHGDTEGGESSAGCHQGLGVTHPDQAWS